MAFLRLTGRWPRPPTSIPAKSLEPLGALGLGPLASGLSTSSAAAKSASAAAATEALRGTEAVGHAKGQRRDALDSSFDDAHAAYKSKTTWEILRAYIVYTLCSSNYLVENNMKVSGRPTGPLADPDPCRASVGPYQMSFLGHPVGCPYMPVKGYG